MFAIQNRRTGKFLFGTDYRYNPPRQRTSFDEMRTYPDLSYAVADYNNRRCGEDYRIVVLKSVEVERVIDYAEHLDYDMRPTTTAGVEKIVEL
jgi:hypothetical protein